MVIRRAAEGNCVWIPRTYFFTKGIEMLYPVQIYIDNQG